MRSRARRFDVGIWTVVLGAALGCGPSAKKSDSTAGAGSDANAPAKPEAAEAAPAYTYPAPVSGHYEEVNLGSFDLVDGVAWERGGGTVVQVTSEPIASPKLVGTACPTVLARSIAMLRDARWIEVTIDPDNRSSYYAAGSEYAGTSREQEVGGGYWKIDVTAREAGRIAGGVDHRDHGSFRFDLPLVAAGPHENSAGERLAGAAYGEPGPATPPEAPAIAAYSELRAAAAAKDWPRFLTAHGYPPDLVRAIRGLPGIEEDLVAHAARFLAPGEPGETTAYTTTIGVRAEGTNPAGQAFVNFYQFAACGDGVVLVSIGENPQ
jgi:hypothetical protein